MAINTPEVRVTREIIETYEEAGGKRHRFRWTVSGGRDPHDSSGFGHAWERTVPASREILLDRWHGLTQEPNGDSTKLEQRLMNVLFDLTQGVTRLEPNADLVVDGEIVHSDVALDPGALREIIRDWIIDRAEKYGR